jgi:hypothetical protein
VITCHASARTAVGSLIDPEGAMLSTPLFITVLGLPFHPLIVHATVVAVPVAALAVGLAAVWPRFRGWIDWGAVALSVVAVLLDPLTTSSGEALEHDLPQSPLIHRHAELADALLPWLIALLVGAAAIYILRMPRLTARWTPPRVLLGLATAVAVLAAVGSFVWVILVGHAGANAAWHGVG